MRLRLPGRPADRRTRPPTSRARRRRPTRSAAAVTTAPAPVGGPRPEDPQGARAAWRSPPPSSCSSCAAVVVLGLGPRQAVVDPAADRARPADRHGAVAGHPVPAQAPLAAGAGGLDGPAGLPRAPSSGIIAAIAPSVADQVTELADAATAALQDVQEWLQGPPFNLGEDQIGEAVDSVINSIQGNAQNIAGYALTGASAVGNSLINLILALVLVFFFLKDGPALRAVAVRADRPAGRAARGGAVATRRGTRSRSSSASRRWSASSTRSSSASGCGSSASRWCSRWRC